MDNISMSDAELLKFAIENGMLDTALVQEKIEMQRRKELLEKHPFKIWEGQNGCWYTYLPDDTKRRMLKKRNTRDEIEDIIIRYWKEQLENPTIEEVFSEWNDRRLELKKISAATHLRNKQVFNRHFSSFGERKIKHVQPEEIEEFLEEQIPEHDLTAKAFANLKTVTRGFLKRAKKRKLVNFNVEELFQELDVSEVDFKKVIKEDYQEVFSEEEMPVIVKYLEDNPDLRNLGILLMFVTGTRIGEIVTLKREDFVQNTFKIRRTETRYCDMDGKYICEVKEYPKSQAGVRTVIVPDDYTWIVERLLALNYDQEYIFMEEGKRLTTQAIRMRLKRVCRKTAIYHKSPHKIRKTYGSILLDNHIDNRLIIGQMGHTEILCTENHYHRNRRSIERKSGIISAIPEFQVR